ncbi:MAG: 4Fe-4S dicluster domain-containing protein [Elusimicrobia bacterium]|nr:4Fe-4S dicluster domain-containing protein [Elusimicrobiota bacterium]
MDGRHETEDDETQGLRRREFLAALAASFAAAGCGKLQPPKEKIVAAIAPAEEAVAGTSLWYATACPACPAGCGVLAKVRDGRPIKLEGNPEHPVSRGGLCARGQATVLDLYDSERFSGARVDGTPASFDEADLAALRALEKAGKGGKNIVLLTGSWPSPTARAAVREFLGRHPGARHVAYDPVSYSAIAEAHRRTHGRHAIPTYRLEKARAILSIDADFLGTWLSPMEFTKGWVSNRKPDAELDLMSWHGQFEARMSLTGAAADLRVPLKPSERFGALAELGRLVAAKTGWTGPLPSAPSAGVSKTVLADVADLLASSRRHALVLSGADDAGVQLLVNWLNHMLGAYEELIDLSRPSRQAEPVGGLGELLGEMKRGEIGALIVRGANPAQDHPRAAEFREAASRVGCLVSLASRRDETSELARIIVPEPHTLECWGDNDAHSGVLTVQQPAVSPVFPSRPALETLAFWSGRRTTAYELVRERWLRDVFPRQTKHRAFETFWEAAVRDGFVEAAVSPEARGAFRPDAVAAAASPPASAGDFELVAFAGLALATGAQANNPWLQELPDPIAKTTWGNVASFSPSDFKRLGLVEGRLVRLSASGVFVDLPAHSQPGQAPGTVAAALGYGRTAAGNVAANFPTRKVFPIDREAGGGADVFPLSAASAVGVTVLDAMARVAKTQTYDYLVDPILGEKRDFARETTLQDFARDPRSGNPPEGKEATLWPEHEYEGHRWAMAIDLNACTGCSGCVVGCMAENNVPVVGKAEVGKSRDMHWLRIDRYYSGSPSETPESPDVSFQPMLCQHCGNAPCETVCPVLATVHSTEGLNMQVYNRCVGTRYCANNCPYKVRRFNWFDYAHDDLTRNLALNPDVTVRTRGIMEKCSFCVQRIYTAKGDAKVAGRVVADGDVKPACAQSCPAEASVFGDLNDPDSRISKLAAGPRAYRVLGELGVDPSVRYLTRVRNKKV